MMKLIFAFATLTLLFSCNEKIDLIGDFKETAVVYGLLDHSDSMHYVKITRAFIGPGNALELAQIEDSSYFDAVDATIEEIQGGNVLRTWTLKDTLIENKDTNGVFYAPFQKVYYFKTLPTTTSSSGAFGTVQTSPNEMMSSLNPDNQYRLKAVINSGEFEVSGITSLVNGMTTTATSQNFTFKFASNPGEYKATSVTISNSGNAYVVNAQLGIRIAEYIAGESSLKTINWQVGESDVSPNSPKTFSANGAALQRMQSQGVKALQFSDEIWDAFGAASKEIMDENMDDDLFRTTRASFEASLADSAAWISKSDGYYVQQRVRVLGGS